MPEILALGGLVIATLLYFLLIRRRASERFGILTMHRALTTSNEIALERMRLGMRRADPAPQPEPMRQPDAITPTSASAHVGGTSVPDASEGLSVPEEGSHWRDGIVLHDRRASEDRRRFDDRRRGRGRRTGADRRRNDR